MDEQEQESSDLLIQYRTHNEQLQKQLEKLQEENAEQAVLIEREKREKWALQEKLTELDRLRLAMSPNVELNISTNQEQARLHIRPFQVPMNYEEVELLIKRLEAMLEESYRVLPTKTHTLTLRERDKAKYEKALEERKPKEKPKAKPLTERKALSPLESLAKLLMTNEKLSEQKAMEKAKLMMDLAQGTKK